MASDPLELAKLAYTVYGDATGNKNFRGDPMPGWDGLAQRTQAAWTAAADAVQVHVLKAHAAPTRAGEATT
ncbi:hypothetical protein [Streptomyces sp. NPDC051554]|uniref:hypothetical protein n=1 Tax=Streptomyces sp. NPDC051554 TaxID=3365656 RepID=UPI0037AFB6C0